jgi:hypothetical protein
LETSKAIAFKNFLSKFSFILRSTDTNIISRGNKNPRNETLQIAKQFKIPGYPDIQTITTIYSSLNFFLMNSFITDRLVADTAIEAVPH